jgi:sarcosine oxidase subunit alpha
VVATGAYETPLLFGNNDLPGVMLSSAALRLLCIHGIRPGNRAVVVGERTAELAETLRQGGVEIARELLPNELRNASGSKHVNGAATLSDQIDCDLIVVCGPRGPDAGLLAQAGAKLMWIGGAFVPQDLPAHVTAVGSVLGSPAFPTRADIRRRRAPALSSVFR